MEMYLSDRLEHLRRHVPRCLSCGTDQVQLTDWHREPALWRCRRCKLWLTFEPAGAPKKDIASFQEVVRLLEKLDLSIFNRE